MVLTKKRLGWAVGILLALLIGAIAFVYSGAYNVAADEPHWGRHTEDHGHRTLAVH